MSALGALLRVPSRAERLPAMLLRASAHSALRFGLGCVLAWMPALLLEPRFLVDDRPAAYAYRGFCGGLWDREQWIGLAVASGFTVLVAGAWLHALWRFARARRVAAGDASTYWWIQTLPGACLLLLILVDRSTRAAEPPGIELCSFDAGLWRSEPRAREPMLPDLLERTHFLGRSRMELEQLLGSGDSPTLYRLPASSLSYASDPRDATASDFGWRLELGFDPTHGVCDQALLRARDGGWYRLR